MPDYRRSFLPGGTFFFTVVTYLRRPILTSEESREILRSAWMNVASRFPFTTEAICLLPDHLHCIWTLPEGDSKFSLRWAEIKKLFSREYRKKIGAVNLRTESQIERGEAALWQRRFWEHTIRDEVDYHCHLDYIHFNPVKHGLVTNVADWRWSSFHRFVGMGFYERNWGASDVVKDHDVNFGE